MTLCGALEKLSDVDGLRINCSFSSVLAEAAVLEACSGVRVTCSLVFTPSGALSAFPDLMPKFLLLLGAREQW